jgi:hypothetical protein
MYRIHIVGCSPRSGTTLMAEMMYNCFNIDLYSGKEDRIGTLPFGDGNVFLTKSPKDIVIVDDVLKYMKKIYVIYMLRDPRDVISSKHPSDNKRYWSSLKFWKLFTPFGHKLCNHPRFITVRYEDLVQDPDHIQKIIQERMPFLKSKELFSNFHKSANPSPEYKESLRGLRPVNTDTIGNWRNHKGRVLGQIKKHGSITDDLIRYGYEKDSSWERELEGVDPNLKSSHPSAFSSSEFIAQKRKWNKLRALRISIGHSKPILAMISLVRG